MRVGQSNRSRQAPDGRSQFGVRFQSPAEIPGVGPIVKGIVGKTIGSVKAGKVRKIVKLFMASTYVPSCR